MLCSVLLLLSHRCQLCSHLWAVPSLSSSCVYCLHFPLFTVVLSHIVGSSSVCLSSSQRVSLFCICDCLVGSFAFCFLWQTKKFHQAQGHQIPSNPNNLNEKSNTLYFIKRNFHFCLVLFEIIKMCCQCVSFSSFSSKISTQLPLG